MYMYTVGKSTLSIRNASMTGDCVASCHGLVESGLVSGYPKNKCKQVGVMAHTVFT